MRDLRLIVGDARDGKKPDIDEMRYAICVLDILLTFDGMALMKLARGEATGKLNMLIYSAEWQWQEHHRRIQNAMSKSPKEYLGNDNDPDNPDIQERRRISMKIFEKFQSSEEPTP